MPCLLPLGYEFLWPKTRAAFKFIYENHLTDVDWFYKADDDTYVIMENLRQFLSKYNSTKTHFFGRRLISKQNYHSGGAGYAFTRKVLIEFYEAMKDKTNCKETARWEDVEFSNCLLKRNIYAEEAKDYSGRQIFHHLQRANNKVRSSNFSNATVSFHHISANEMYEFDFMLYNIRKK